MFRNIPRYFHSSSLQSLFHNGNNTYRYHLEYPYATSIYGNLINQYPTICHTHYLYKYVDGRRFSSTGTGSYRQSSPEENNVATLRRHKRFFAIGLFSCTLLVVWLAKRKKLRKLKYLLEDCVRIPINESLFGSKFSVYRYHGYVFPRQIVMSGVLQELPNFAFLEGDIIVASFPETATPWVQGIVSMLTHDRERGSERVRSFDHLEHQSSGLRELSKRENTRLISTHLPSTLLPDNFAASGAKLIYVVRNPRDTAVSYWKVMKLLPQVNFLGSFKEFFQLFTADQVPYGPYPDHIKSYLNTEIDNVLIISYEDIKENQLEVIKNIAEFLQVPIKDEDPSKLAAETSNMVPLVSVNYWEEIGFADKAETVITNGESGDWNNHFDAELTKTYQEWEKTNDLNHSYL